MLTKLVVLGLIAAVFVLSRKIKTLRQDTEIMFGAVRQIAEGIESHNAEQISDVADVRIDRHVTEFHKRS